MWLRSHDWNYQYDWDHQMKIFQWYGQHIVHAFSLETYWPWQKGWWLDAGIKDVGQYKLWNSPKIKKAGSFLIVVIGFNLFIYALLLLLVIFTLVLQSL